MKTLSGMFAFLVAMMVAGAASADTSPSTLNMGMWQQAGNYNSTTGHWTGTASTGASGTTSCDSDGYDNIPDSRVWVNNGWQNVSLNGFGTLQFSGYNALIASRSVNQLLSTSAWSTFALVKSDGEGSDGNTPDLGYNATHVMISDGVDWGVATDGYSTTCSAIAWQQVSNGDRKGAQPAFTDSAWQFIQAYYDGSQVCARVNSASWTCGSSGSWSPASGTDTLYIGGFYYGAYFNGQIAELGVSPTTFSQSTFDGIKAYMNTRYGTSL